MSNIIKKGDIVRVSEKVPSMYVSSVNNVFKHQVSKVEEVDDENAAIRFTDIGIDSRLVIPCKYLIKDGEKEDEEYDGIAAGKMIPKIMFNIEFWVKYEADLAKEIAVKVANRYNSPEETAEYAAKAAKQIVKHLKENK